MSFRERNPIRCNAVYDYMKGNNLFAKTTEIGVSQGSRYHFNVNEIKGNISVVRYSKCVEVVITVDTDHTYLQLREALMKRKEL